MPYSTLILIIIYSFILLYTIIRILLDTSSTPKTLAYLLLVFMIPLAGILVYYLFGINYRHIRFSKFGRDLQIEFDAVYTKEVKDETAALLDKHQEDIGHYDSLVHFLNQIGGEYLSLNKLKLLINGEEKFPEVLRTLETAETSIHMEYYDWENDTRGNQIKEILLKKAAKGINVRVLYDDYASRKIKHNIVKELKNGGVEIFPKIKVRLKQLANRLNHRDHRKIIIIDGKTAFIGGINISDRYDNSIDTGLYWRDTHMKISGPLAWNIQRHFIVSWNSSAVNKLPFSKDLFTEDNLETLDGTQGLGQLVAGGPIYPKSNIMLSYVKIFSLARKKLYVTNPYFIPNESIMDALKQAAISGVDVRLMLPFKSDSAIVGAASRFYFADLLQSGVRIFLYKKGFVHAKTVIADSQLSVVGTANIDIRSFDLNFEIMAMIYGKNFANELESAFVNDLNDCVEIVKEQWKNIGILNKLKFSISRLISSFL